MPPKKKQPVQPEVAPEQSIIEEAGLPSNWVPVDAAPIVPSQMHNPSPTLSSDSRYSSGPLPPNFGYQPALVNTRYPKETAPIDLVPIQGAGVTQANAKAAGVAKTVATKIVNQAIAAIPPAATVTQVTDGLTHGDSVWEHDSAYVEIREEFVNIMNGSIGQTNITGQPIGTYGWVIQGGVASSALMGGAPPYIGWAHWENSGTVGQAGFITLNYGDGQTGSDCNHTWALFDNPGWKMTWVFKLDATFSNLGTSWATTKKGFYIGLVGGTTKKLIGAATPVGRPDMFIGLRYDTSATSPAISDTTFVLEVVENATFTGLGRHNTQGTTFVTSVTPTQGVWHRLDIICNVAGKVTIILDGSSTNTLTATISQFTMTSGAGGLTGGLSTTNAEEVTWTVGAGPTNLSYGPWAAGSVVTISGFTGVGVGLNGTFTLFRNITDNILMMNNTHANIATQVGATGSVVGYPAFIPGVIFGNDDTAGPAVSTMCVDIDFFSIVWNPNLGPNAPGTPNSSLPRYW